MNLLDRQSTICPIGEGVITETRFCEHFKSIFLKSNSEQLDLHKVHHSASLLLLLSQAAIKHILQCSDYISVQFKWESLTCAVKIKNFAKYNVRV